MSISEGYRDWLSPTFDRVNPPRPWRRQRGPSKTAAAAGRRKVPAEIALRLVIRRSTAHI
jgi:hypothetical protein